MKSFLLGACGALVVVIAFGLGQKSGHESHIDRYQMHVSPIGEITRLDKKTGTLHSVGGMGIGDLPEHLSPPALATATVSPAHQ